MLTDKDVDISAFKWWVSVNIGTKGRIQKFLFWGFSLLSVAPKGLKLFRALPSPMKTTGALKLIPLEQRVPRRTPTSHNQICFFLPFCLLLLGNGHNLHWGLHKAKQLQCQMEIQQALPKMYCSFCTGWRLGRGGPGHNDCVSWEAHPDNGLCVKGGTD